MPGEQPRAPVPAPPAAAHVGKPAAPTPPPAPGQGGAADRMRAFRKFIVWALVISGATLVLLFTYSFSTQREELVASLKLLDPLVFLIAVGLHFFALSFWGLRLYFLADGAGHPIPFRTAFAGVLSSAFAASLTPARMGGEPMRFAVLTARGTGPREASLIVMLERVLDLLFLVLVALASMSVLIPRLPGAAAIAVGATAAVIFLVLLIVVPVIVLFQPRVLHPLMNLFVKRFGQARLDRAKDWIVLEMGRVRRALAVVLTEKPSRVPLAIVATVIFWLVEYSVIAYLLHAFGHDVSYLYVVLGAVLVTLLTTLPLLPGGAGVAELGALGVFAPAAPGLTPTFILVWRIATYYMDILVGGFFAIRFASAETMRVLTKKRKGPDVAKIMARRKDG